MSHVTTTLAAVHLATWGMADKIFLLIERWVWACCPCQWQQTIHRNHSLPSCLAWRMGQISSSLVQQCK